MPKLILTLLLTLPSLAFANGTERLMEFFEKTSSMRAQFQQVVTDNRGQKVQEVSGTMLLLRPGKFRWAYQKPYEQEIVGDGTRIWLFDPELNQVTVRNMSQAIGSSPAALLAGSKEVEQNFVLENLGVEDKLDWVLAKPKDKDSGFDEVRLGFSKAGLERMNLKDSYGNLTSIQFSKLERNPNLNQQTFMFKPPQGADVVGE
ncbi:MAG: outer membrane lipoprotein chaperone LolA [Methylophilaceae bacterium]|nr:outer membrane lipoprotein chaperone LolA [Methylophilaceae bacterium]